MLALYAATPVLAADTPPSLWNPNLLTSHSIPVIDGKSGALTQSFPLDLPPGRNGIGPNLSLDYNSQNTTQDSEVGYGWALSIPYVQRLNKTGTQDLYGANPYFSSSLDGELTGIVVGSTTGYYLPRIDDGSFHKYTYATSTNSWTMFDKKGNEYFFGSSGQSQQYATSSPNRVYKWMLERIQDPNGNYVRYVYAKDSNQIYPSQIIYTGNESTDGPMTITFATSTRPDAIPSSVSDFKVTTKWRISQITAMFGATTVRRYDLGYATGNNGSRSLLTSIQRVGWGDTGAQVTEPATTFGYVSTTTPFATQGISGGGCGADPWVASDVTGDGINDVTTLQYNANGPNVWQSVGGGSYTYINTPGYPYWSSMSNTCPAERGSRLLDVNGSGKAVLVHGENAAYTNYRDLFANNYSAQTGPSWVATTSYTGGIPLIAYQGARAYSTGLFGNLNGTGLPSYELALPSSDPNFSANGAYFGNGSAWDSATTTIFQAPMSVPAGSTDCTGIQFVDVNGDGLDDWIYADGTNTYARLNTGTGWESTPDSRYTIATSTLYSYNGTCYDRGMRFVDVNGDGLSDFVRSYIASSSGLLPELGDNHFVYLNTGNGWATSTAYSLPHIIDATQHTGTADNELFNFKGNGQQYQDVLSTIAYPRGGSTDVSYGYTTQTGLNTSLPYNLLVATKIVNHDGHGSNEETHYAYNNGLQYLPQNVFDRKFAGFGSVTASTSQSTTVTYYTQGATSTALVAGDQNDGYGQMNHPYRKDVYTPGSALTQSTFYRYDPVWHGNSVFIGLGRKVQQDYARDGSHMDKAFDYFYSTTTDDLLKSIEYGHVAGNSNGTFSTTTLSSPRTTFYTYAASSTINLSAPIEKLLVNNLGATTTDTRYYYDSLPFGQVALGNMTKQEDWVSGAHYASSTKAYNAYGLVTQGTDRDGNSTAYTYDSYNLYPAAIVNALSQSTAYTYDYANGKVKQTTNPNDGITRNSYDGLGRLIETDESDPANPSSLLIKLAISYTDSTSTPPLAHETDYFSAASTTDTYDYYDGLNRLIQERKSSPMPNTWKVTDRTYDDTGNLLGQSLPYFSLGSSNTSATTTGTLYTTYAYDSLGRVTKATNAVGSTTNAYSLWTTTTADPDGHQKSYILDAFGNLAQVVEYGTGSNATTTYAYDAANNLTKITDANGNVRNFTYSGLGGRLTAEDLHTATSTSFGAWSYSYDDAGNLISQTNPKGQVVTHTFDVLNRMLTEVFASSTQVATTYDSCLYGIGRACVASSTGARYTYAYDALGRTTIATTTISDADYVTRYAYDRQGNVTSITNPNGSQIAYGYNPSGLVSSVTRTNSGSTTPIASITGYAPTDKPGLVVFGSNASTTYSYDSTALYRLSRIATLGTASSSLLKIDVSLWGAGGGGSSQGNYAGAGAGGGAGAYVHSSSAIVSPGTSYAIYVGRGGTGGINGWASGFGVGGAGYATGGNAYDNGNGYKKGGGGGGGSSAFPADNGTIIAAGGGGGGASGGGGYAASGTTGGAGGYGTYSTYQTYGGGGGAGAANGGDADGAGNGGSGGGGATTVSATSGGGGTGGSGGGAGGSAAGTSGNGANGNNASGGTGGSGAAGSAGASGGSSGGGDGSIGSSGESGGGGGGGNYAANSTLKGGNGGSPGAGGGGGGFYGGAGGDPYYYGGNGADGRVIISYPTSIASNYICNGTATTTGSNTLCIYTSSGTFGVATSTIAASSSPSIGILQDLNYTYDPAGNILTRTDNSDTAQGQQVTYGYDNLNRLTAASTAGGVIGSYDQSFTYDPLGNITGGSGNTYTYGGAAGLAYTNPDAVTQTTITTGRTAPTIAYDNSTVAGNGTAASSLTFSYTVNSNANGVLVLSVSEATSSPCTSDKVTGVTDNGAALTDLGYYTRSSYGALKTYYLFHPVQGTHNITISASASCILYAAAASYTGVKQSGMPDASGEGNPLSDSGAVTFFQATTTPSYNAWPLLVGVPSAVGSLTAGLGTTIRGQQIGGIVYADSNGPASSQATGLGWNAMGASVPTAGLLDYYPLDGNSNDIVGSNNGTDTNISYGTGYGKVNQGASFNGTSSKIVSAVPSPSSYNSGFSISLWVYLKDTSGKYYVPLNIAGGTWGDVGIWFDGTHFGYQFGSSVGRNNAQHLTTATYSQDTWYHVVITHGGAGAGKDRAYINGSLVSTNTGYTLSGTGSGGLWLGAISDVDWILGNIDEVGIWGRELSSSEVSMLYNSGSGAAYGSGTPLHWLANYFSLPPLASNPGVTSTTTYGYDANGNLLSKVTGATTTAYAYDYLNRLVGLRTTGDSATTTYGYDAFGSRVFQGNGLATTTYPSKYYSLVSTKVASTTTATSTEYFFAGDTLLATVDQKLVNGTATGTPITRYVHTDNLGSTQVTSDETGHLAQWFNYAPYGSVIASTNTGSTTISRQFEGLYNDTSGLVYSNARYLNPAQGQFLTQDPVFWEVGMTSDGKSALADPQSLNSGRTTELNSTSGFGFGNSPAKKNWTSMQDEYLADPQMQNAYAYARDNPITNKDPQGLWYVGLSVGGDLPPPFFFGASLGLRIDGSGIVGFVSAGPSFGVTFPAQGEFSSGDLSHQSELAVSRGGEFMAIAGLGMSSEGIFDPNKPLTRGTTPMTSYSVRVGLGASVSQQYTYSIPLMTWGSAKSFNFSQTSAVSSLMQSFGVSSLSPSQTKAIDQVHQAFSK